MNTLSEEIQHAREEDGLPRTTYPLLPFPPPPLAVVREGEPSLSAVASELQLIEAICRTAYAARVRRGAMTPEVAWHRMQCLSIARRVVEERSQLTGE